MGLRGFFRGAMLLCRMFSAGERDLPSVFADKHCSEYWRWKIDVVEVRHEALPRLSPSNWTFRVHHREGASMCPSCFMGQQSQVYCLFRAFPRHIVNIISIIIAIGFMVCDTVLVCCFLAGTWKHSGHHRGAGRGDEGVRQRFRSCVSHCKYSAPMCSGIWFTFVYSFTSSFFTNLNY